MCSSDLIIIMIFITEIVLFGFSFLLTQIQVSSRQYSSSGVSVCLLFRNLGFCHSPVDIRASARAGVSAKIKKRMTKTEIFDSTGKENKNKQEKRQCKSGNSRSAGGTVVKAGPISTSKFKVKVKSK